MNRIIGGTCRREGRGSRPGCAAASLAFGAVRQRAPTWPALPRLLVAVVEKGRRVLLGMVSAAPTVALVLATRTFGLSGPNAEAAPTTLDVSWIARPA